MKKMIFCTYPENAYPDTFTEKFCPKFPDKLINTVIADDVKISLTVVSH